MLYICVIKIFEMKNIFTILFVSLFISTVSSQEIDTECPLNPDFIQWQNNYNNGIKTITTEGFDLNEIPVRVKDNFDRYLEKKSNKEITFDAFYDLRAFNWVSPIKNQGSCGVCWTFATLATIESRCLKKNMGLYDLSEQGIRSCHGFYLTDGTCSGGNAKKSTAYMTRYNGPILEADSPYDTDPSSVCENGTPYFKITGYRSLANDANTLKQAILDYGAIYTNMYHSSTYYNSSDYTYYYDGTDAANHAITLVGWDDNKVTAGGTGAWIIKNSWGASWGENGYFYISYNDSKVATSNAYWTDPEPFDVNETIYMYDEFGHVSNRGYGDTIGFSLVKFIVGSQAQNINKVGTWVNTAESILNIEIYNTKNANTLSGLLATLSNLQCETPGYYSFPLTSPIPLAAGEDFYVKVKYVTPGYNYPIPYEVYSANYAEPEIEDGVCWYGHTGTTWTEAGSLIAGKEFDLCVRAYGSNQGSVNNQITNIDDLPNIYPNPCNNILNIDLGKNAQTIHSIKIINIAGETLVKKEFDNSTFVTIDCSSISNGIYFIITESNKGTYHQKLIIN